jgi:predicted metalloprotease with PDZ domain
LIRLVEYTVSLDAPQTQTFQIAMRVRSVASRTLDVALPVWRQGRYSILNPAASIRRVNATTDSNRPLSVRKIDKTTWRIETEGASEIIVRYTVFANSLIDRTRHVDDTHAFLSGATVFMLVPERRADPLLVRLDAPAGWTVACGLDHEPEAPRTLLAPNYDVLADSPIEIGVHELASFELEGKRHDIAVWGNVTFDSDRLEQDLAKIIRAEAAIFGDLPYDRYVFILHVSPGLGGGTEHLNSTVMQMTPAAFEDEKQYKVLLSLAAHEMFHTWNVKRLRPAALRNIDLMKENYTDLLWFCEGATSYYDELIPVRAGLQEPERYLETLAEAIYQWRARPGAREQSPAESSFDAWIRSTTVSPDDVNSAVSYYDAGALVSLLLDLEIRKRTQNHSSLDILMRAMYESFPVSGAGFTAQDLIQGANRITNSRFEEFFEQYVYGTSSYPFEELFSTVGLELVVKDGTPRAYLGVLLQDENGACTVRSVLSDGPAYAGGVNCGDEIVALNGRKFKTAQLVPYIERALKPGDTVWLQVLRRRHLRRIEFRLGTKPYSRWELRKLTAPAEGQRAGYTSWLGCSF